MKLTSDDFDKMYQARHASCEPCRLNPEVIIRGTFVDIFGYYFSSSSFIISILCFIPDFICHFIPEVIKRLIKNSLKPSPSEMFKLDNNVEDDGACNQNLVRREYFRQLSDQLNPDKEEKNLKANYINDIRKCLYSNSMKLEGTKILNNLFTFGNEINEALSSLYPNIVSIKSSFLSRGTCVTIKDINSLQNEISKLLHENIEIIVK